MANTRISQMSFARGEICPALYGRADLEAYAIALKTLKNGFVQQEGCVSNRAGLEFVGEVRYSNSEIQLIPFTFNINETYIIEAGAFYFRFIQDGGYLYYPDDYEITELQGKIVEISTPYSTEEIQFLKYTQSADILTICHQNHPPKELTRYSHYDWRLEDIIFEPSIQAPVNVVATWTGSTSKNKKIYKYCVTAIDKDNNDESTSSEIVQTYGHKEAYWETSEYMTITWEEVENALEYNIYKDVNGVMAYIGTATDTSFMDDNIEPDTSSTAPKVNNPFENDNNPSCCCYFQQRKIFANTSLKPQTLYASRTSNFNNFNFSRPLASSDSVEIALLDKEVNEIKHLISFKDLIALTTNNEYKINGTNGVFEATPPPASVIQSCYGASDVQPIVSGSMVLYVQSGGTVLRDLGYDYLSDQYQGDELSIFASHLFDGKEVKYIAYAKEPNRLVFVLFTDGTMAVLTYNKKQKMVGWSRWETDGKFLSVACVREGQEDIAYFVIERFYNSKINGDFEFLGIGFNSNNEEYFKYKIGETEYYCKNEIKENEFLYLDENFTQFIETETPSTKREIISSNTNLQIYNGYVGIEEEIGTKQEILTCIESKFGGYVLNDEITFRNGIDDVSDKIIIDETTGEISSVENLPYPYDAVDLTAKLPDGQSTATKIAFSVKESKTEERRIIVVRFVKATSDLIARNGVPVYIIENKLYFNDKESSKQKTYDIEIGKKYNLTLYKKSGNLYIVLSDKKNELFTYNVAIESGYGDTGFSILEEKDVTYYFSECYENGKSFANYLEIKDKWQNEAEEEIQLIDYQIRLLDGSPKKGDTLTLVYETGAVVNSIIDNSVVIGGQKAKFIERAKTRVVKNAKDGFFVDSGLTAKFEYPVTSVSGLNHLRNKKVVALLDGGVKEDLFVDGDGNLTLKQFANTVTVGLPYEFEFETLGVEAENTHGLKKNISAVSVRVLNSRQDFFYESNMGFREQMPRSPESINDSGYLFTGSIDVTPLNEPREFATMKVVQPLPLPITITSISAIVNVEDIQDGQ